MPRESHLTALDSAIGRYLIGYNAAVSPSSLISAARRAAGLSQQELATRSRTSRPTISAYEHGRKSPSLGTAARIVGAAGFDLGLQPRIAFMEHPAGPGRAIVVPTALPRLPIDDALATVELPIHLNWAQPGRRFDLRDRRQRARAYEIVLREGSGDDVLRYIDGALLTDLWDELVLPAAVRSAWADIVRPRPPASRAG